jgi:hypothetical protein
MALLDREQVLGSIPFYVVDRHAPLRLCYSALGVGQARRNEIGEREDLRCPFSSSRRDAFPFWPEENIPSALRQSRLETAEHVPTMLSQRENRDRKPLQRSGARKLDVIHLFNPKIHGSVSARIPIKLGRYIVIPLILSTFFKIQRQA